MVGQTRGKPTSRRGESVTDLRKISDLETQLNECAAALNEALAQQTATAEILQVINSSPGDLATVFDAMLEKAIRLCDAAFGHLLTYDGEFVRAAAIRGASPEQASALQRPTRPEPGSSLWRIIHGEAEIHIPDITADATYRQGNPTRRILADLGGARTALWIPLRQNGKLLGVFTIYRREVRPFSDKQIALVQSFAAQAVVAMENARLLNELRDRTRDLQEALDYQTATSDVLKVISQSVADLDSVLSAMVSSAVTLCRAEQAVIFRSHGGEYRWAAGHGLLPEYDRIERETIIRPGPGSLIGRVALEGRTVTIRDAWNDPLYEAKEAARAGNVRSMQIGRAHV